MAMFFFISSYFSPTSCDRKGKKEFLKDKLKRLGWPMLASICGNYVISGFNQLYAGNAYTFNFPDAGVTWFLGWNIIFSVAYTVLDQPPIKMEFPTLRFLTQIGGTTGVIQIFLMLFFPSNLNWQPNTISAFSFYCLFFAGGVIAKRNDWITNETTGLAAVGNSRLLQFLSLFYLCAIGAFVAVDYGGYFQDTMFGHYVTGDDGFDDDDQIDDSPRTSIVATFIMVVLLNVVAGMYCTTMSLCIFDVAYRRGNWETDLTKFLAGAAYAAYLVHPYVIVFLQYINIAIIRAMGHEIYFTNGNQLSSTVLPQGLLWASFVVLAVLAVPLSFGIGGWLHTLPVLKDII